MIPPPLPLSLSLPFGTVDPWKGLTIADTFGAVYTATYQAPEDGTYLFKLSSDDGAQLFIDGNMVINDTMPHNIQVRLPILNVQTIAILTLALPVDVRVVLNRKRLDMPSWKKEDSTTSRSSTLRTTDLPA